MAGKKFNNDVEVTRDKILNASDESKIYFGVDSERTNVDGVWYVDYLICVILHEDGCHGASVIYGTVERERDFDKKLSQPRNRLFTEVLKIAEVYMKLQDSFGVKDVELHLDLNPNELFGSSCVINEAIGYIKSLCGLTPKVKPESFAASIAADRLRKM
jgi:predicted RNase H-related nuclease YkuK (DUF458 family)